MTNQPRVERFDETKMLINIWKSCDLYRANIPPLRKIIKKASIDELFTDVRSAKHGNQLKMLQNIQM